MDPNQVPNQPTQPQFVAPSPVPGETNPTAQPQPQPQPTPVYSAPLTPAPTSTGGSKSKTKLIAAVVGVVIALGIVGASAWALELSPAAQAKHLSANFMQAMTTGDVTKATELTGDSSAKNFLTTQSTSVRGSYKLAQSNFTDGKGYYLYDLTNAGRKYARTIIQKDSGKLVVHSLVASNTALALVPGDSVSVDTSTTTPSTTPAPAQSSPTNGGACLAANDFSVFTNLGHQLPTANGLGTYSDYYQLEFNPDAATYKAGANPDSAMVFSDFKNFYAQNASKNYAIELEASVNSATPDQQLANAREQKVQSDLQTISGIPAAKVTVLPVTNATSGNSGDSFYRQVQIKLRSGDSCTSSQH